MDLKVVEEIVQKIKSLDIKSFELKIITKSGEGISVYDEPKEIKKGIGYK